MNSQKLENILNLALQTEKKEQNAESDINVGYNFAENTWELIVKYNGDLTFVESLGGTVEELILGYAIIIIPENRIPELIERPEIEYVENGFPVFFRYNHHLFLCREGVYLSVFWIRDLN